MNKLLLSYLMLNYQMKLNLIYKTINGKPKQNDEILELFKLYMNLGNNSLFKLIILLPFCLKKILMKAPTYIGVISLAFVVLIIICQSPYFIDYYYDEIYIKDDKILI